MNLQKKIEDGNGWILMIMHTMVKMAAIIAAVTELLSPGINAALVSSHVFSNHKGFTSLLRIVVCLCMYMCA